MAVHKPPKGHQQGVLSFLAPPPAADRESTVRAIVLAALATSRRPQMLGQVIASVDFLGMNARPTHDEIKQALHALTGLGKVRRDKSDTHMWAYSLREGGAA